MTIPPPPLRWSKPHQATVQCRPSPVERAPAAHLRAAVAQGRTAGGESRPPATHVATATAAHRAPCRCSGGACRCHGQGQATPPAAAQAHPAATGPRRSQGPVAPGCVQPLLPPGKPKLPLSFAQNRQPEHFPKAKSSPLHPRADQSWHNYDQLKVELAQKSAKAKIGFSDEEGAHVVRCSQCGHWLPLGCMHIDHAVSWTAIRAMLSQAGAGRVPPRDLIEAGYFLPQIERRPTGNLIPTPSGPRPEFAEVIVGYVPTALAGEAYYHDLDNLHWLCGHCNTSKSSRASEVDFYCPGCTAAATVTYLPRKNAKALATTVTHVTAHSRKLGGPKIKGLGAALRSHRKQIPGAEDLRRHVQEGWFSASRLAAVEKSYEFSALRDAAAEEEWRLIEEYEQGVTSMST